MARDWEDRVEEYVDSPRMRRRLKSGKRLFAEVHGNYGVYSVSAGLGRRASSRCTCPSEYVPCKHVEALRRTYRAKPGSFFDLDRRLKDLRGQDAAALLKVVRAMAEAAPAAAVALGAEGFEDESEEEDGEWEGE